LEWAVLDKLAARMHKQDASRNRAREVELQHRFREDLTRQVADVSLKHERERMEERKFHEDQVASYQQWQAEEHAKGMMQKEKLRIQKEERDRQVEELEARRKMEKQREQSEAHKLTEKLQDEMLLEKRRVEQRAAARRDEIQKALEVSNASAQMRDDVKREQATKELKSVEEYRRLQQVREKEAMQRKESEEGKRNIRESAGAEVFEFMKAKQDGAAAKVAAERHARDNEASKAELEHQRRLKEQRVETQAYLLQQMREKQNVKQAERESRTRLRVEQETDAKAFHSSMERQGYDQRVRNMQHKAELERQIASKMAAMGGGFALEVSFLASLTS